MSRPDVAHALLRAASRLFSTPCGFRTAGSGTSVANSGDAARKSPCATSLAETTREKYRLGYCLVVALVLTAGPSRLHAQSPEDLSGQIGTVKRVFVDRLTGGETAAQMRDLIISSLQGSKLFVITENAERADAFLRGAAEDLVYTDSFQSSEGVNAHLGGSASNDVNSSTHFNGSGSGVGSRTARALQLGAGEHESSDIHERKHEAMATVRIVNKDGDVIWSTTQESNGAKFRGASADVADKITRQLVTDMDKLKRPAGRN